MSSNAELDLSEEIQPIANLDRVQRMLDERKEMKMAGVSKARKSATDDESTLGTNQTEPTAEELEAQAKAKDAEREKEKKRKEAERAKQEKLREEAASQARAEEIKNSPWIACRPKVRKARVDLLDKIYNLRKVQDYEGTKQDFYDEGLALLEEKYSDVAKEVLAKQTG